MCGESMNIRCTVSFFVEAPPKSQPIQGMSRRYGIPHPADSSMSRRYPASIIVSSSNTAVCVWSVDLRDIGIESTAIDSKPPSSRRRESHTWSEMFVLGDGTMRGLIWSVVPADTSSSDATSVPITRTW